MCSYLKEVESLSISNAYTRDPEKVKLSINARKKIAFLRVWCLAEIYWASKADISLVIKAGKINRASRKTGKNSFIFENNKKILRNLSHYIDIKTADATFPEDKDMIMKKIEGNNNGIQKLNDKVRGIIISSIWSIDDENAKLLQNAACGDYRHLELVKANPFHYLVYICAGGFTDLLRDYILRDHEEELKASSHLGEAINKASAGGHTDLVRILIENGADINAKDKVGWVPLLIACKGGLTDTARLLIEYGADVEVTTSSEQWTSLMLASRGGYFDTVELLVENKANVSALNENGDSAIDFANQYKHEKCASYLTNIKERVTSKQTKI